ncbi:MAG TPA: rod shape-determining protein MreD [Firmicutes bacterium]|jgi:rod shape-determining protein MreD|nr:rod shape-determining protein MreD [Bacillota bacterium]HOQ24014.1 rod shape-determining protein MreD [Bacillota bacterium]HPT67412.1 rod shape-determining protein MreD [Bacillota bacterium]
MRGWILAIIITVALVLQTTVIPFLSPLGLIPDFILLLTLSYGLLKGPFFGVSVGFTSGFIMDFASGDGVLGVNALAKMVAGLLCGLMEKNVFKDNLLVPAIAAFVLTLIHDLILFLVLFALGWQLRFLYHFLRYTLPLSLYHALLAPLVYYCVYRLERYLLLRKSA